MSYKLQNHFAHLGVILYRLSYIGLFCMAGVVFSQVLTLLIYLILIMIGLLSLLTLFFVEGYRELFDVTNSFNELLQQSYSYFPLVIGICLVLILGAILCMLPNYKNIQTRRRLIPSFILLILFVILLIIGLSRGGSHA